MDRPVQVFDIGGTRIRTALSPAPGRIGMVRDWPTPRAFADFADSIAAAVPPGVAAVVLSIAGVIDPATGLAKASNLPAIDGRAVAALLSEQLGCPIHVENDADCLALAEARLGAGRGKRVVLGLVFGTGVGGGLVLDGRLHRGAGGYAGEWGHGPVLRTQSDEAPGAVIPHVACGCGLSGCIDTLAGSAGLTRLHACLHGQAVAPGELAVRRQAGDVAADRTFRTWCDLVGSPLAMLVNAVGPDVVPVGGGFARTAGLVDLLDAMVRQRVLRRPAGPLLVPAQVSGEPGLVGASLVHEVRDDG